MRKTWIGAVLAVWTLCGAVEGQPLPKEWNVRPQIQGLFQKLESGQAGSMMILGDSLSFRPDSYNWFLRDRFWADYGMSGDGYLGLGPGFTGGGKKNASRDPLDFNYSGSVVFGGANGDRPPAGYCTPDGIYGIVSGAGWLDLVFYGPETRLHYLVQPGGGTMRLRLNGVPLMDVATGGSLAHGAVSFNTGRGPYSTSVLRITSVDGAPVQAIGLDMRTGLPGFTYHRIARGGSGPDDFVRSNTTQNADLLAELAPDLLIVMLDWARPSEKDTYLENINLLLDFYTQVMPSTPVVLMSHHPFRGDIYQEASWLYEIAQQRGMGFINLFDTFPGGLPEMQALGFMDGDVHLTAAGGKWFGDYVYNLLKHDATCKPPVVDEQPGDLEVVEGDPAAFTALSGNATEYQWRKDGAPIPGATQNTLWINAVTLGDAGVYDCLVTNDCDTVPSAAAVLTVNPGEGKFWWYRDADGDGHGNAADAVFAADPPDGYVADGDDCNDADPAVHPGAEELLNGIDDDCDGVVDNGFEQYWYLDADADGYGDDNHSYYGVHHPELFVAQGGDCDDHDPSRYPGAVELLNGIDDDCDGVIDNGFEQWWYRDADGDGFGTVSDALFVVQQPQGYVPAPGDCDDADAAVYPGAPEVCDGLDNDCNGQIDDGAGPVITQDPKTRNARLGDTVVFTVSDSGGAAYQWRKNGKDIAGASGPAYEIVGVKRDDSGVYSVVVSSPCGEAISKGATLRVVASLGPVAPTSPR